MNSKIEALEKRNEVLRKRKAKLQGELTFKTQMEEDVKKLIENCQRFLGNLHIDINTIKELNLEIQNEIKYNNLQIDMMELSNNEEKH